MASWTASLDRRRSRGATFQQREGLRQTARLDRATRDRMNLRALLMDGWSSEPAQSDTATERSGSSTPPN
jgi:hypothetical protein